MQSDKAGKTHTMILGAAGFIGTNLTLRLLNRGEPLILYDRKEAVYPDMIQKAAAMGKVRMENGSFAELLGGRESRTWMDFVEILRGTDIVYHLISTTCPSNTNQDIADEMRENLISTTFFLDACVAAGVSRVVFLSSGGTVYGKESGKVCREEQEPFPITGYGLQKLGIEKLLYLYRHMYDLDYRIIRLSNPYGPYQKTDGMQGVVSTFTWKALHGQAIEVYGDGSIIRDYIYIDDAIDGILRVAEQQGNYRLYNLGSGCGHTILEVIQTVENIIGRRLAVSFCEARNVDVPINVLDISRFRKDFGEFTPIPLQEGIKRLLLFLKEQEEIEEE